MRRCSAVELYVPQSVPTLVLFFSFSLSYLSFHSVLFKKKISMRGAVESKWLYSFCGLMAAMLSNQIKKHIASHLGGRTLPQTRCFDRDRSVFYQSKIDLFDSTTYKTSTCSLHDWQAVISFLNSLVLFDFCLKVWTRFPIFSALLFKFGWMQWQSMRPCSDVVMVLRIFWAIVQWREKFSGDNF